MLIKRPVYAPRAGAAAVEMAFALPLMLLLLVGTWEVGRMVEAQQVVSNAAREGARQAAAGKKTYDEIKAMVLAHLEQNGIQTTDSGGATNVEVGIANTTTGDSGTSGSGQAANYNPQNAAQLDDLECTVTLPYANVQWVFIDRWFFDGGSASGGGSQNGDIQGRARWASMKDIPISVDTGIPQKPL